MPSQTKSSLVKKGPKTSRPGSPKATFQYAKSDVLVVPVALMAIVGLYFFVQSAGSLAQIFTGPLNFFFLPGIPALLVVLFSCLFLYRVIRRESVSRLPLVVASLFSVALVIIGFVLLTVLLGKGTTCPISSDPHQDCGQLNAFMLYLYVNNPLSYGIAMILAVVGSVSLLRSQGKK
jgi:hypothetical protein